VDTYQAVKTLNVKQNSSQDEIKTAFRKKALELHPDKNKKGDSEFKKITEAYNVLKNNQNNHSTYQEYTETKPKTNFKRKPQWGTPEDEKIP